MGIMFAPRAETAAPLTRIMTVWAGTALPLAVDEACAATQAWSVSLPAREKER